MGLSQDQIPNKLPLAWYHRAGEQPSSAWSEGNFFLCAGFIHRGLQPRRTMGEAPKGSVSCSGPHQGKSDVNQLEWEKQAWDGVVAVGFAVFHRAGEPGAGSAAKCYPI